MHVVRGLRRVGSSTSPRESPGMERSVTTTLVLLLGGIIVGLGFAAIVLFSTLVELLR